MTARGLPGLFAAVVASVSAVMAADQAETLERTADLSLLAPRSPNTAGRFAIAWIVVRLRQSRYRRQDDPAGRSRPQSGESAETRTPNGRPRVTQGRREDLRDYPFRTGAFCRAGAGGAGRRSRARANRYDRRHGFNAPASGKRRIKTSFQNRFRRPRLFECDKPCRGALRSAAIARILYAFKYSIAGIGGGNQPRRPARPCAEAHDGPHERPARHNHVRRKRRHRWLRSQLRRRALYRTNRSSQSPCRRKIRLRRRRRRRQFRYQVKS